MLRMGQSYHCFKTLELFAISLAAGGACSPLYVRVVRYIPILHDDFVLCTLITPVLFVAVCSSCSPKLAVVAEARTLYKTNST